MNVNRKNNRRVTIYDIAKELDLAPSSVSKALNDMPNISDKIKLLVKSKAKELNYKHNLNASNLRKGSSSTIAVIVPKINVAFFSNVIAGMEEACFEKNHRLIICQTDESFTKEIQAVETLIHQNVDCILISLSLETKSTEHLQEIINNQIELIQFDRVNDSLDSYTIVNENKDAAYNAVKHLIDQGYKKIAFLGGPDHLKIYMDRKEGYLKAIKEANITIPYNYVVKDVLTTESGMSCANELLHFHEPPDAFFTISDYSALGVLKAANSLGFKVPQEIGIVGFSNESFTEIITPTLSSVDQNSRKLGKDAANVYFNHLLKQKERKGSDGKIKKHIIKCSLIIRDSSSRKKSFRKIKL